MKKELRVSLAWGGGIVALALAATLARSLGYIDQETTTRLLLVPTGLMVAFFGNRIPKTFSHSAHARQAQRVAAWSLVLSGLAYAAAFIFAPLSIAVPLGCGAIVAGLVVTFGYCQALRARSEAV